MPPARAKTPATQRVRGLWTPAFAWVTMVSGSDDVEGRRRLGRQPGSGLFSSSGLGREASNLSRAELCVGGSGVSQTACCFFVQLPVLLGDDCANKHCT